LFFYAIDVNAVIKAHRTDTQSFFGFEFDEKILMALLRQVLVAGFYPKTLRRTDSVLPKRIDFIKNKNLYDV
jgi:ATP-dependent DNA helicase RecQ